MKARSRRGGVTRWVLTAGAVLLVGGPLLGGCGGAGDGLDSGTSGDAAGDAAVGPARETAGKGSPPAADTGTRQEARRSRVQTRAVIRKGEVVLEARNLDTARAEVEEVLSRTGGHLANEDTRNNREGRPERSVLVLRVPEPAFNDAMAALTDVGRTVRADRRAEDVTTQVIDVDTQVATHRASLSRLQRFLRQARTVEDMIRLESEIAERQAQLESLEAQQAYLRDQTALSTITVRMHAHAAAPPTADSDTGFLAGLRTGWTAMKAVLVGAATLLGAVVPFLVVTVLVGVPAWLVVRTVVRRRQGAARSAPVTD